MMAWEAKRLFETYLLTVKDELRHEPMMASHHGQGDKICFPSCDTSVSCLECAC